MESRSDDHDTGLWWYRLDLSTVQESVATGLLEGTIKVPRAKDELPETASDKRIRRLLSEDEDGRDDDVDPSDLLE